MERAISRDGTPIGYLRSGSGPPLLLVHGTTADHSRWADISPRFEDRFTVHVMDRRGRGGSGDGVQYDIMREAEDVAAVVEAIGAQVSIVGHSYGAVCSLEAALRTDLIDRMVLYEPPIPTGIPMYPAGIPDRMDALIEDEEPEKALELFFREVVAMPDHELSEYRRLPMWQRRVELVATIPRELAIDRAYRFDPDRFAAMGVPTLLLLGGDSPPLFRQAIDTLEKALPSAEVVVMAGQQHIAMDTDPDLFVREVSAFLSA